MTKFVQIDQDNAYMQMIRNTWGARLRQVFSEIPDPTWRDAPASAQAPRLETKLCTPVRAPLPAGLDDDPRGVAGSAPIQLVAQGSSLTVKS